MAIKKRQTKAATAPKPAPQKTAPQKTAAQAEFDRHKARAAAQPAPNAGPGIGFQPYNMPPQTPMGAAPWGMQATVVPWPPMPTMTAPMAGQYPQQSGAPMQPGSMGDRLGSTLRLGLDLLNAGLAGGVRALGGLTELSQSVGGWAYGGHHPQGGHHHCHGECSCCHSYYDCCDVMNHHHGCGCGCEPSVGSCC